jgi:xylulose-5-phosphate/fructose-6-phosphate phosphoketolase
VINRVPRLQVAGAHVKERLRDMQLDCLNHAHEQGVDRQAESEWTWPGASG